MRAYSKFGQLYLKMFDTRSAYFQSSNVFRIISLYTRSAADTHGGHVQNIQVLVDSRAKRSKCFCVRQR